MSTPAERPRLSVVVPVYDVEAYLPGCLDSLLAQQYTDFEVVLVDDGSTDRSAAVADSYAHRFDRLRLVRTANHGLGAARNTGASHAEGDYLAFVDSDDTLPADAYAVMVDTLERTGSDLVVGSVLEVFGDGRRQVPGFLRPVHEQSRLQTTADAFPAVLSNVFAWSKVFRRGFWDNAELRFPEGVRYEDQPLTTEAYIRARTFDVLAQPVYHWWRRCGASTITQRRHELADLRDRLATKQQTTELVERLGSPRVRARWYSRNLVGDLPLYFAQLPTASDEYWSLLSNGLRELFDGRPSIADSVLAPWQRLVGWLVVEGRRADAEEVLRWQARRRGRPADRVTRGGELLADLPFLDQVGSGIPVAAFRVSPPAAQR